MNIDDVTHVPQTQDLLGSIFSRQTELLEKYKSIEGIPDYPFDIDALEDQVWIKDFLWRVSEEIAESMEAVNGNHLKHGLEELSDALHFLAELMILVDIFPSQTIEQSYMAMAHESNRLPYDRSCMLTWYQLGLVGNTLKNKKWKRTPQLTDKSKFKTLLQRSFNYLIYCFYALVEDLEPKDIYNIYFKKSEVNHFRIRTNY